MPGKKYEVVHFNKECIVPAKQKKRAEKKIHLKNLIGTVTCFQELKDYQRDCSID